jgi:hypothetical protein
VIRSSGFVRRALGATAAAGVGLVLVAPQALGADNRGPITSGPWEGSQITTPERVAIPNQVLGAIINDPNLLVTPTVTMVFSRAPGIPAECTVTSGPAQRTQTTSQGELFNATTNVNCNGAYPYTVDARVTAVSNMPQLRGTLVVEVPPSAVSGVSATLVEGTRNVSLKWTGSTGTAPDFLGYRVQRRLGSGQWITIDDTPESVTSMLDDSLPADPGEYSYRVLARRGGADDDVLSAQGTVDSVTLPSGDPTTDTTLPDDGTGTTVPGTPGDGTTPGGDGTGTPGDGSTSTTGKPTVIKGGARPSGTTRAPNLGTPAQSNLGILLNRPAGVASGDEDDGGFDESLPFGDPSIDGSLAEEAEDGESSIFYTGENRGLAIPIATGFVLFAWAIHLRFLARASRPEAAPAGGHYRDPFDPFYDPML